MDPDGQLSADSAPFLDGDTRAKMAGLAALMSGRDTDDNEGDGLGVNILGEEVRGDKMFFRMFDIVSPFVFQPSADGDGDKEFDGKKDPDAKVRVISLIV